MPFGQSAIIAVAAAELSGLLMKHATKMTPKQIDFCKGVIAFIAGEAVALPTVDAIGGALTIPIAVAYLLRALEVPDGLARVIGIAISGLTGGNAEDVIGGLENMLNGLDAALA